MPAIPWPTSNSPGSAPGEGSGTLVNCHAFKDGDATRWRPLPGLDLFATPPKGEIRGWIEYAGVAVVVVGTNAYTIDARGIVTVCDGSISGTGPVSMSRDNELPSLITVVSNVGTYIVKNFVASGYPDSDLPNVNSVSFLDGFTMFTAPDGTNYATELNSDDLNPLSFAKSEARPDGLIRGVVKGQQYYAMGANTVEVYQDVGSSPFPLARNDVIPVGLIGPWAVAGFEDGWGNNMLYVASDSTVRSLDGHNPVKVSTDDLERLIAAVPVKSDLRACVYTFGGHAMWTLSSPDWTWGCDVANGYNWHERKSYGSNRWRGSLTLFAFGKWLVADRAGGAIYTLNVATRREGDRYMIWGMDSGPVKSFPNRVVVSNVSHDFVMGEAAITDKPEIMLSWSLDGGRNWNGPLTRSTGLQGIAKGRVRVDRLGMAAPAGFRSRFRISDPAYTSFAGATAEGSERK